MATISKYQTASGKILYRVRYRKLEDNKPTDKRGFETKRDAKAFAETVEVDKRNGNYISPTLSKVTVGSLGPDWLKRQKGHMKPSGFRTYESAWRNHVEPRWADTRIGNVRFSDVQAWVAELAEKLSASMVANTYSVLARILDDAARDRLIAANPARGVRLPRRAARRNVYLTAEQLHHLADESGRYRSLVLLLGTVGLRWGEAAALRVSDVDFLRRRITLDRNAVQVGSEVVVGTLKTGKRRTVSLPGFVADALAKTCGDKGRDDLVWPSASGGHLGPPSSVRSWLAGAVARCQESADAARAAERKAHPKREPATPVFPRITAHALRHTAASLAISSGANVLVVQRMLGHASAAMTLDVYADLFDSDLAAVADRLDENVGNLWARRGQTV